MENIKKQIIGDISYFEEKKDVKTLEKFKSILINEIDEMNKKEILSIIELIQKSINNIQNINQIIFPCVILPDEDLWINWMIEIEKCNNQEFLKKIVQKWEEFSEYYKNEMNRNDWIPVDYQEEMELKHITQDCLNIEAEFKIKQYEK